MTRSRAVHVALIGPGLVGKEVLRQLSGYEKQGRYPAFQARPNFQWK
jgi:hypothetical protein